MAARQTLALDVRSSFAEARDTMIGSSVLIDDAAVLLGVSRRTVYYWIRSGRLQTIRTRGGSQRVLLQSIARVLDESLRQRISLAAQLPCAAGSIAKVS